MPKIKVIIIGGGPSALIAADFLSPICDVKIYEKEKNVGQKFLVAGKGGFNLTNSLRGIELANKYKPNNFLKEAILNFDSQSLRSWLQNLGIETFVGTSGRVFSEKQQKPFEILDRIKQSLKKKLVKIYTNHTFNGFDKNNNPTIAFENEVISLDADYYIFALGGASWPVTGSDGKWTKSFNEIGIETNPFQPSNCGINITWPQNISAHHLGKPLKNIMVSVGDTYSRGEAVITEYGLEGNAIYAVVPQIRDDLAKGESTICIDLKPNNTIEELLGKIVNKKCTSENYKTFINLNSLELSLIKTFTSKEEFLSPTIFTNQLKCLRLDVDSLRPVEEAISTVGGVDLSEISSDFYLKKHPNIFVIGEMVDWDAPTGGFLLQGCFSMGAYSAKSILSKRN